MGVTIDQGWWRKQYEEQLELVVTEWMLLQQSYKDIEVYLIELSSTYGPGWLESCVALEFSFVESKWPSLFSGVEVLSCL